MNGIVDEKEENPQEATRDPTKEEMVMKLFTPNKNKENAQESTRDPTKEEVSKTSRPGTNKFGRRNFPSDGKTETAWTPQPVKKPKLHLDHVFGSKEPLMSMYQDRLASLMDMNISLTDFSRMRRAKFAASGFFPFDSEWMKCFFCGVKIRGWEDTDDPYIIHVDQSPLCDHIWTVIKRRVSQGTLSIEIPYPYTRKPDVPQKDEE